MGTGTKVVVGVVIAAVIGVVVWKFSENKETTIQGPETTPAVQEVGATKAAAEATAAEDAKKAAECIKEAGSDQDKMAKCAELLSPAAGASPRQPKAAGGGAATTH